MRRARVSHRRPGARVRRLGLRRVPRVRARPGAALRASERRRASSATAATPSRCWCRSARYLVPLRDLDPVEAAPLADAGVTPYRAVVRAVPWLTPGARVLLIGLGGLGQFAIQYLRRLPDLTIAVRELDPDKLALAAEPGRRPGPAGRRRVAGHAGPGRPRRRRVRLRGHRRDAGLRGAQRGAGRPDLAGGRGGRPPAVRLRPTAGGDASPPPPPGARSTTCARWCGWRRAAGCAGRWSACRCARRAPPTIGCWPAR